MPCLQIYTSGQVYLGVSLVSSLDLGEMMLRLFFCSLGLAVTEPGSQVCVKLRSG